MSVFAVIAFLVGLNTAAALGQAASPETDAPAAPPPAEVYRQLDDLQSTVNALQAKVVTLEADAATRAERAEALNAATAAALEDARQRIDYQAQRVNAGHDGLFFLESPDGGFRLTVDGHLQVRYIANFRNDPPAGADDELSGFSLRRTKIALNGHVDRGRRFFYNLTAAGEDDFDDGQFEIESVVIGTEIAPNFTAQIGQFKLPFAREELISSKRQLGVDRSVATESFTLDFGQGVLFDYTGVDRLRLRGMIGDGADTENLDFDSDDPDVADVAFTGRADYTAIGSAKAAGDVVAWPGEAPALLLGVAGHVQLDDSGSSLSDTFFTWTLDALYKRDRLAVFTAFYALHTLGDDGRDDFDDYGALLGVGYSLTERWQPYLQFSHIDLDDEGDLSALAAGVNYFIDRHRAKLTADVLVLFDPNVTPVRLVNRPGTTIGLLPDSPGEDEQVSLRAQFQLLF
ncbi:MAG: porin [Planctomycetota bacterium]